MREALFVKQNRKKWEDFEVTDHEHSDALAERFIEITNDLAYSKTFYPESKTTAYLNGLATKVHQSVYTNKKENANRFIAFWKSELPLIFYHHRKKMLYSFIFFALAYLIGFVSAKYNEDFLAVALGPGGSSYVNTTKENIAKGDPFGVYKSQGQLQMFIMIAGNNIFVSLRIFVMGVLLSLGTVVMLLYNGVMLGAFQYFFIERGLGAEFILVVYIHGTLEISAIILAGGAGLIVGNSLLFPKTYSRLISFKKGAKDGMKVVIGLIPIFLLAAFLESFITRYTTMHWILSGAILFFSAAFIIWYAIIYPKQLFLTQNVADAEKN